ncbi:sensor histidine kinase [Reinekea marinisedimentorum]|uniref:histidine kinase n=1 Tax=Reinekea marinisedimentorum TaxID=230495 RepID=A0A4R3IAE4_9GAMM|nr:HAMP domain-containing sensor histidine kinase [Reinekea marinisedimentorum]TCS43270.1 two-component system sensor histidine kinase BaeS [Reinekea marinisedimentorum]
MKNLSLRNKLMLSYLLIAFFSSSLIYGLIRLGGEQRVAQLIHDSHLNEIHDEVLNWYRAEQSWQGFQRYFFSLHPPKAKQLASSETSPEDQSSQILKSHGVVSADNRVLIRFLDFREDDIVPNAYLTDAIPVQLDHQTVAYIVPGETVGITLASEEQIFLQRTNEVLLIAIIASLILATLLALLFSRIISKPVQALTSASEKMAQGRFNQQIPVQGDDEISRLVKTFNKMSDDIHSLISKRTQFTADISHDLGTPLQIISGYVETALDGDMELTKERLHIIANEAERMRRLIKDLSLLASSDDGNLPMNRQPVDPDAILTSCVKSFTQASKKKKIHIHYSNELNKPETLQLDPDRMEQVIGNILSNALRFTPAHGQIDITLFKNKTSLCITIKDNGIGAEQSVLANLFDRSFQADSSRSAKTGNKGLGLAISKALVEAQGGLISAASEGLGKGLTIRICFPADASH